MLDYELRHKVALLNPYRSVVKTFDIDKDKIPVGIKNVASIPNTLMHKLENYGYALHTIDKKSQLAGRAVDTELINPITGHIMSGSSSGTAINVFAGINDLGIGNDGGGSVLAPAICLNILSFISKKIEEDRVQKPKPNTDGMVATNSIGFMTRDKNLLIQTIEYAINIKPADDYGLVYSGSKYEGIESEVIELMDNHAPRNILVPYLEDILKKCDVLLIKEGPVDLDGFGDSLFGHFDERTRLIQEKANKGYVRVCNIAGATAMSLPMSELGCSYLLMCENDDIKISRLLRLALEIDEYHDPLIERYFLDHNNYFIEGYKV